MGGFDSPLAALQRLQAWEGLRQLDDRLDALRRPTSLFLLAPRILRVEGVHSDILSWLLNPTNWHGLGDRFVAAFVHAVLAECGDDAAEAFVFKDVWRECSTGDGPVDLLLEGCVGSKRLLIAIENKIDSPEGEDQLPRYCRGLAKKFDGDWVVLAFLTLDGREPRTQVSGPVKVAPIGYELIADLLERTIPASSPADPEQVTGLKLVEQYVRALRTHVMSKADPTIDTICRELYREHREAWRAIRRRLPSEVDETNAYLASEVCRRLGEKPGGEWQFRISHDGFARVFRPGWKVIGARECEPLIGVGLPGATNVYPRVHFRLVVNRTDADAGATFKYRLLLKVNATKESPHATRLLSALCKRHQLPDSKCFRLPLKSTRRLPGIKEPDEVPDRVVEWFVHNIGKVVSDFDSVLPKQ